jgi:hypothetical protein
MNEGTAYGPAAGEDSDITELARLADELVEEIGAARRHHDDLRAALDGGAAEDGAEHDDAQTAVAVADAPAEDDARDEDVDDAPPSVEGARLVALNLALMGVERELAREKLCKGFEVEPEWVEEILDDAFGNREHKGRRNGNGNGNGNGAGARRRFRRRRNGSA